MADPNSTEILDTRSKLNDFLLEHGDVYKKIHREMYESGEEFTEKNYLIRVNNP